MTELDKRHDSIRFLADRAQAATEELRAKIDSSETLATLEDIYLPFRPKKRTKATIAKEKGLEPLAELIWVQDPSTDVTAESEAYAGREYEVDGVRAKIETAAEALGGARDILAERINDDAEARAKLRNLYLNKGVIKTKAVYGQGGGSGQVQGLLRLTEPASEAPSHRILAIRRGEAEGFPLFPPYPR